MSTKVGHIQVQTRRTLVFAMRSCFRFFCSHPFLVMFLCLLFLIYRSTPLLFNLLLAASPILVCTASLLGTLLMFGKPDIPEVEKDKVDGEVSSDETSLKDEVQRDSTVTENQYELIQKLQDKGLDTDDDSFPQEAKDSCKQQLLGSSTHRDEYKNGSEEESVEDIDDNDDNDDSDQDESWSPDASMADIAPMLDELHPLLDLETPLPSHVSHVGSDASSERSNDKSDESNDEWDDEDQGEEEQDRDDNNLDEDGDEECEAEEGKEDESKKVITWTEDDQKNLMDLGSLELERNQRLETLIARRRARKTLSMLPERNLIDFETADLPFNIPLISTRRQNPFDIPNDSYENFGLPPIPGSAPSFLATRRNPFDIPYDSNEEKPDLKGDGFEDEFFTVPQKETAIFRRHGSFSTGPSVLGGNRRERLDARLRPIFVPEQMASEETSYGSFHRQLSEISESKGSSVPDTDSVTSVVEQYDKKLNEQELYQETDVASNINLAEHVEHGSQSSEDVETIYDEQFERDLHRDEGEITLGGVNSQQETEGNYFEFQETATSVFHVDETHEITETVEEDDSSSSSTSSLSEGYKYVTGISEEEESPSVDLKSDVVQDNGISKHSSSEESYYYDTNMLVSDNRNTYEEEEERSTSVNHKGYLDTSISKQSSSEESHSDDASMRVDDSQNAEVKEEEGSTSADFRGNDAQGTNIPKQTSPEESYFKDALVGDKQTYDVKQEEGSTSVDLGGDLVHGTSISKQTSPEESYFDDASVLLGDKRISDMQKEEGSSSVDLRVDHVQKSSISKQPSPEESYFDDASTLVDDEQNSDLKEEEGLTAVDLKGDAPETSIAKQLSPEESYFNDASTVLNDSQHKEPVYDSSPQAVDRFLSFKSVSSDLQAEISEMCSTPNSLDTNGASSDRGSDESVEMGTPDKERMSSASSQVYTADGSSPASSSREAFEVAEHDDVDGGGQNLDNQNGSEIQGHEYDNSISPDSTSSSSNNGSAEKAGKYEEETEEHVRHEQDQVSSLELNAGADIGVCLNANVMSESTIDSYHKPTEEFNLSKQDEKEAELLIDPVEADCPSTVSSEILPKNKHETVKEEADEQDQVCPLIQGNMTIEKNSNLHELDHVHPSLFASQEDSDRSSASELAVPVRDMSSFQEQQPLLVNEKAPDFHASIHSEKIEHTEENSVLEGDVLSSEQDKVHASSSDDDDVLSSEPNKVHVSSSDIVLSSEEAKADVSSSDVGINADRQNLNAEAGLSSGHQPMSSEENALRNALSNMETRLSCPDESMGEQSLNDEEETKAL